jgi:transposase InsO family protein
MKKVSTVLLFLVSFHILSGWAAVPVYAQANQAAFAGNLILKKTYIKTAGPVSLTRTEWVEAFTPTAGRFDSFAKAKMELFDYLEVFYNQRRRHSTLGQISPAAFERRTAAA